MRSRITEDAVAQKYGQGGERDPGRCRPSWANAPRRYTSAKCAEISPVVRPRAVNDSTISSTPVSRRHRFFERSTYGDCRHASKAGSIRQETDHETRSDRLSDTSY